MSAPRPTAIRNPGQIPAVTNLVMQIQEIPVDTLPEKFRPAFKSLVEAIISFARVQHQINHRQWDRYNSLPSRHASTHKGGDDTVEGSDDPTTIEAGTVASPGTPQSGYAPIDHDHDVNTATAVSLGEANAEGSGAPLARAAHVHRLDVRVAYNGTLVGTRKRINFTSTGTIPTDDAVNDEIDTPLATPDMMDDVLFAASFLGA